MKLIIILAILAVCQSFRFPSRRPGLPQLLGMKQIKFALRRSRPVVNSINDHLDAEHVNDEAMKEDLQKIINAFKAMINLPIQVEGILTVEILTAGILNFGFLTTDISSQEFSYRTSHHGHFTTGLLI